MRISIHIYVHIYICTNIDVCINMYMYIYIYICMYTYTYMYIHIYKYLYRYVYVYVYLFVLCACIYVCIYTHVFTCTSRTHTRTYKHRAGDLQLFQLSRKKAGTQQLSRKVQLANIFMQSSIVKTLVNIKSSCSKFLLNSVSRSGCISTSLIRTKQFATISTATALCIKVEP